METLKLHRGLAIVNLVILLILIADTFVFKKTIVPEVVASSSTVESRGSHNTLNSFSYSVKTESGHNYDFDAGTKMAMIHGDTFYAEKSGLFKKPVGIIHWQYNRFRHFNYGLLSDPMSIIIFLFIAVISLLNIWNKRIIKNINRNEQLIFSASSILLIGLVYYYFQ